MLVSNTQLPSSSGSTVTLTAVALDAIGQTIAGRVVLFSVVPTEDVTINTGGVNVSDVNGLVTATLTLGANKANRAIVVTATVDGVSTTATINVAGTNISASGNSSVALNASTTLTYTVKDFAGTPVSGVPVTVTSLTGNTLALTPATALTGATGVVSVLVTATKPGVDTLAATAAGATITNSLTVSADSFAFQNPTVVPIEIPLSPASGVVSVAWSNASGVVVATPVNFSTTRGVITGVPAITNASGVASVSVSSTLAGAAIITATGTGGTPSATLPVVFVATTATGIIAQANPATIQTTTGSAAQTGNSSVISVTVRDAANNLVKNATVNFTITADPTAGTLNAATATTDVNGIASVSYTAGATTSPQNGVAIAATVVAVRGIATPLPQPTSTVTLTVSGQTLFVRLGTDNTVSPTPPTNLMKTYSAIVTDAAGNPVVNQRVGFVLRPGQYAKGYYVAGLTQWIQVLTVLAVAPAVPYCPNEDVNFNGIIDPLEDTNLNGRLDPGGVASVNAFGTTDVNGIATASIVYPKNYASWAEVTLEATAGVVGTDPPTRVTFVLPGLASDYVNITVSPPGQISPFGQAAICTNPL
ncbi:MAG: Ig-like domain-containing protein [Gallionella sp.]|nr:Ig-like domain-containing protein [Gallionella sp.]